MILKLRPALAFLLVGLLASPAAAHFNMLLPQVASAKRGESVTIHYQWGHPFEHQLFDAPPPQSCFVLAPDGKKTDLTTTLAKISVPTGDNKKTAAFQLRFTPDQRGDYLLFLTTPPIWLEEEEEFVQDTVKVVLHVQAQRGWDRVAGLPCEMVPLTRPYGLLPGMVFQAQVQGEGKPSAGALVEIERYNPAPPKELPPDEHITRTAKTDRNGVVTCTLPEPGWWCLTAGHESGKREHQGKMYPLRRRGTLWVFVDANSTPAEPKKAR